MNKREITKFLDEQSKTSDRNIVIIDFANVDRWMDSLGWSVGVKQLAQLVKYLTYGKQPLRRFYYGEDYGPKDRNRILTKWSATILNAARFNRFEIVSKPVKYIPDSKYATGFIKKCNLDIEMAIDLIKEVSNYDKAFIFSGDGDLACVIKYLRVNFSKEIYVFCARNHIGKELIDAKDEKVIKDILFVEDFEYRLNMRR